MLNTCLLAICTSFGNHLWHEEVLMEQLDPYLLLSLENGNSAHEVYGQTNYSYNTNKCIMCNFPSYFQESSSRSFVLFMHFIASV